MLLWSDYHQRLNSLLAEVAFSHPGGGAITSEEGFRIWLAEGREIRRRGGRVYLTGNGASASMSSHFAVDLLMHAGINAQTFFDPALLTALANDISYEAVFSEPLRRCAREGDLLVAISSSGRSANVLRAVEAARAEGIRSVTLSAMGPDNPLRAGGDLNIYVAAQTYGEAESCHAALMHYWVDMLSQEQRLGSQ